MNTTKISFISILLLLTVFSSINVFANQAPKEVNQQTERSALAPKEKFKQKYQRFILQQKKKKITRQYDKAKTRKDPGNSSGKNLALKSLLFGIVSQAAFFLSFLFAESQRFVISFSNTGSILILLSLVAGFFAVFLGIKVLNNNPSRDKKWVAILGIILGGFWGSLLFLILILGLIFS